MRITESQIRRVVRQALSEDYTYTKPRPDMMKYFGPVLKRHGRVESSRETLNAFMEAYGAQGIQNPVRVKNYVENLLNEPEAPLAFYEDKYFRSATTPGWRD